MRLRRKQTLIIIKMKNASCPDLEPGPWLLILNWYFHFRSTLHNNHRVWMAGYGSSDLREMKNSIQLIMTDELNYKTEFTELIDTRPVGGICLESQPIRTRLDVHMITIDQ